MFKLNVPINEYVSLGVMLLMAVAVVAGQADANAYADNKDSAIVPMTIAAPAVAFQDQFFIDLNGRLGGKVLQVSIAIVTDLSHFRGEDE